MSLTSDLFYYLKQFDDERQRNRQEYLQWYNSHKEYKGSEGYAKSRAAAEKKRKQADDAARETAAKKIDGCIKAMRENLSKVQLKPPTQEQVSILQVLNMRTTMTIPELDRAAQSMNGNPLCLAALSDIADRHFPKISADGKPAKVFHENYLKYADDLEPAKADSYLNSIVHEVKEILRSPVKNHILAHAQAQKNVHGIPFHIDDLPQRPELVSEQQFYGEIIPSEDFGNFMKQVNG